MVCPFTPVFKNKKRDPNCAGAVKSTCCCYRGSRFGSQHPLDSSQASVAPVVGILRPFLNSAGTRCAQGPLTYAGKTTRIHKINFKLDSKERPRKYFFKLFILCKFHIMHWSPPHHPIPSYLPFILVTSPPKNKVK